MKTKLPSPSPRSLVALDALYFILADVKGGLGPFVAVYLASARHWDPSHVGVAMALLGVSGLLAQTPAGAIVDAVRSKRLVIALGFAGVAVGSLAMVIHPTPAVILLSQAAIGAAGAVFGPALTAVSLGLVGRAVLARRVGRNEALDHTGNVAAAAVAGVVGDALGYGGIFFMVAAMCVVGIGITALIRGSEIDHEQARGADRPACEVVPELSSDPARRTGVARVGVLLSDPRIRAYAAAVVLFHFANAAMLPLVGQELTVDVTRGAASPMAAAIIAAQLVMIPVALLASRLAETWGRKPTFLIAFAVLPIRGILYTFGSSPAYLVAVQLLDGIGAGIFGVVGVLVVADLTRGTGRFNLMQGALATATGLGAALSNLLTGAVVSAAGFDAGFLTLAAVAAIGLLYYAAAVPETLNSRLPRQPRAWLPAASARVVEESFES